MGKKVISGQPSSLLANFYPFCLDRLLFTGQSGRQQDMEGSNHIRMDVGQVSIVSDAMGECGENRKDRGRSSREL